MPLVVVLLLSAAGSWQVLAIQPISDEIEVSPGSVPTSTRGVSMADDGSYVLSWLEHDSYGNPTRSLVRSFNADGSPRTGAIELLSEKADDLTVEMRDDGSFVVSYSRWNVSPYYFWPSQSVRAFDATGSEVGTLPLDDDSGAALAVSSGTGDFVVSWKGIVGPYGTSSDILVQRFGQDLSPSTDVLVATTTTTNHGQVAINDVGEFVVVWDEYYPGADYEVFGRWFDVNGNPGSVIRLNQEPAGYQRWPRVALFDDGGFIVSWTDRDGRDGDGDGVFARRFAPSGVPLSDDIQINITTAGSQILGTVAADWNGGFIVGWYNGPPGAEPESVSLRAFRPSGQPDPATPGELTVNQTGDEVGNVLVALGGNGEILVGWTRLDPGTALVRMFQADQIAAGIFADGFESGDLTAW